VAKLYLVQEIDYIYNDEYYSTGEGDDKAGVPIRAFTKKKNAAAECGILNQKKLDDSSYMCDGDGRQIKVFYKIVEVDAPDDEVAYEDVQKEAAALREKKKTLFKAALESDAAKLFEKYPEMESFAFVGYTPSFNDGDPCTYSLHTDAESIWVNDEQEYKSGTSWQKNEQTGKYEDIVVGETDWQYSAQEEISKKLGKYDEEDFERTFDEGKVTFNKNGRIENEYYDHD